MELTDLEVAFIAAFPKDDGRYEICCHISFFVSFLFHTLYVYVKAEYLLLDRRFMYGDVLCHSYVVGYCSRINTQ
jgi:hypothetical protein